MTEEKENDDAKTMWEKHFLIKPEEISFDFHFYDLFSGDEKKLLSHLRQMLERLKRPDLSGPLYLVIRELLTNSLKAVYKKMYMDYFIQEMGLGHLSYEEWLMIFKTEIETHMADNFANICRDKKMYVDCKIKADGGNIIIEVINDGSPSDIEWKRLQASLKRAGDFEDMSYLFEEETTADNYQEGAGIGVPLISMILRNIHDSIGQFQIQVEDDRTVARLNLPISVFIDSSEPVSKGSDIVEG